MKKQRKILSEEDQKRILDAYNSGRGQAYCSHIANTDIRTVKKVLKRNKVHIRNYNEAKKASGRDKTMLFNETYFETQSHEMAYVLGVFAARASISWNSNSINLVFGKDDVGFLAKIASFLDITKRIKTFTNPAGQECVRINFSSRPMKESLAKLGVMPHKEQCFGPEILQKQFRLDFVRGLFDGCGQAFKADGTVLFTLIHNSKSLLAFVNDVLKENDIKRIEITTHESVDEKVLEYSILEVTGLEDVSRIFASIYSDEPEDDIFLPRKFKDFCEALAPTRLQSENG